MKIRRAAAIIILFAAHAASLRAQTSVETTAGKSSAESAVENPVASVPLYLRVDVPGPLKVNALRPGESIQGTLTQAVFSGDTRLFASGSKISMTVQDIRRRRRPPNDHWPWEIKMFTPRHEKYPTFAAGRVYLAGGDQALLHLSLISIDRERHVQAEPHSKKDRSKAAPPGSIKIQQDSASNREAPGSQTPQAPKGAKAKTSARELTFTFEAEVAGNGASEAVLGGTPPLRRPATVAALAAGQHAKIILLDSLAASKGRPGDKFRAQLVEPVMSGANVVIPEGSILEGHIAKVVPPRWLSRSGSLLLDFDSLTLPRAASTPVSASIAGAELDRNSSTRIDSEGMLRGAHPGKLWTLINLGTTAGIAKEADDGTQLVIEAIVSTATDASTAGTARIAGTCASTLFLITRHGRDVVLPKFTEMDVVFNHSISVPLPRTKRIAGLAGPPQEAQRAQPALQ